MKVDVRNDFAAAAALIVRPLCSSLVDDLCPTASSVLQDEPHYADAAVVCLQALDVHRGCTWGCMWGGAEADREVGDAVAYAHSDDLRTGCSTHCLYCRG